MQTDITSVLIKMNLLRITLLLVVLACISVEVPSDAAEMSESSSKMPVGVCDVGYPYMSIEHPQFIEAFEKIGFDFLAFNGIGYSNIMPENIEKIALWADKYNHDFLINPQACALQIAKVDDVRYLRPGHFFDPPPDFVKACCSSPHFLGIVYDELEHGVINGNVFAHDPEKKHPRLYNAQGKTLDQAYVGNLHNLNVLMSKRYPGFAQNARTSHGRPVVGTENVFPIMHHMFARTGMVQMYKLLKETMTPVTAAVAMGAAKQYKVQYWSSIDLWKTVEFPGHSPVDLRSALLFSYWTGAERTYIETIDRNGTLHTESSGSVALTERGEAIRWFIKDYMPVHKRSISFKDFSPEIIIVRFEDTDWGQIQRGTWLSGWLYCASNLFPDDQTRYWIKIWNVISHGVIPPVALNWNVDIPGFPYRFFIPANNVAVYDHLASDPSLYSGTRLVFLTGKKVSPQCLATLKTLAMQGLVVVSPAHLAPSGMQIKGEAPYTEYRTGSGRWIITNDVTDKSVRSLLRPYLGSPNEMRYVFGDREVVFTSPPSDSHPIGVTIR